MLPFQSPLQAVQAAHIQQQQLYQALQQLPANSASASASPSLSTASLPATSVLHSAPSVSSLPSPFARPSSSSGALGNALVSPQQLGWALQSSAASGGGLAAHLTQLHINQQHSSGQLSSDLSLLHSQQQLYQQYLQHRQQDSAQPPVVASSPLLSGSPAEQQLVSTLLARHLAQQQQWIALQQLQLQQQQQLPQPVLLPATPTSSPTTTSVSSVISKPSSPAVRHVQPVRLSTGGDVDSAVLLARLQAAEQQRDQALAVLQQAAGILQKHGMGTAPASFSTSPSHSSSSSSPPALPTAGHQALSSVSSAPLVELSQLVLSFLASQPASSASLSFPPASLSLLGSSLPSTPGSSSIGSRRRTASSAFHPPVAASTSSGSNSDANRAHHISTLPSGEERSDSAVQPLVSPDSRVQGKKVNSRSKQRASSKRDKQRRSRKHKRRRKNSTASVSSSSSSTASSSSSGSSSPSLQSPSSASSSASSPALRSADAAPTPTPTAGTSATIGEAKSGGQTSRPSPTVLLPSFSSASSLLAPGPSPASQLLPFGDQLDGTNDMEEEGEEEDDDDESGSSPRGSSSASSPTPSSASALLPSHNVLNRLSSQRKKRDRSCLPCPTLHHIHKTPLRTVDVYIEQEYTLSKRDSSSLNSSDKQRLVRVGVRFLSNGLGERELYVVAKDICLLLHTRKGNVAKSIGQFSGDEKCRMPVICPRSDGTVSTHVLTVLSVSGVKRLLDGSRSGVVDSIRGWFFHQLVDMGHPQAQLFAALPAIDESTAAATGSAAVAAAAAAAGSGVRGAGGSDADGAAASTIVGLSVDPWATAAAPSAFLPHPATVDVPMSIPKSLSLVSAPVGSNASAGAASSSVSSSLTSSVVLSAAKSVL